MERVGTGERLLASIPLVATQSGMLDFEPDGADDSPAHDIGLFDLNRPVGQAEVQYVGAQLTVTGGLHNSDQATDTDGDGSTSPLDALRIVNFLNQYGPMAISAVRTLELQASQDVGEQRPQLLYDVNGDGHVTPLDVLQIVNLLNSRFSGEGEEAVAAGQPLFLPGSEREASGEFDHPVDHVAALLQPPINVESRAGLRAEQYSIARDRLFDSGDDLESILDDLVPTQPLPHLFPELES